MSGMTAEEYWRIKAHERLRFDKVVMSSEEKAEFERTHPMPTKEELMRRIRKARGEE